MWLWEGEILVYFEKVSMMHRWCTVYSSNHYLSFAVSGLPLILFTNGVIFHFLLSNFFLAAILPLETVVKNKWICIGREKGSNYFWLFIFLGMRIIWAEKSSIRLFLRPGNTSKSSKSLKCSNLARCQLSAKHLHFKFSVILALFPFPYTFFQIFLVSFFIMDYFWKYSTFQMCFKNFGILFVIHLKINLNRYLAMFGRKGKSSVIFASKWVSNACSAAFIIAFTLRSHGIKILKDHNNVADLKRICNNL